MNQQTEGDRPIPDVKAMTDEDLLDDFGVYANHLEYVTTSEGRRFGEAYRVALKAEILLRMKKPATEGAA